MAAGVENVGLQRLGLDQIFVDESLDARNGELALGNC